MKLLIQYLKPYKLLILLALFLASVNQVFSLFSPMIIGKILDKLATHPHTVSKGVSRTEHQYIMGVFYFLGLLIGTAMVSRIAKAFQDYVVNVIIQKFGAKIFMCCLPC